MQSIEPVNFFGWWKLVVLQKRGVAS